MVLTCVSKLKLSNPAYVDSAVRPIPLLQVGEQTADALQRRCPPALQVDIKDENLWVVVVIVKSSVNKQAGSWLTVRK